MAILPIILDSRPDYLRSSGSRSTLLSLPIGAGTMLDVVSSSLSLIEADSPCVIPPLGVDRGYARRVRRCVGDNAIIARSEELRSIMKRYEPSDWALLIDPRYWPVNGADYDGLMSAARQDHAAVHAVAIASSVDCSQESVRQDETGRVHSIRRYYEGITRADIGRIPYSLVPIAAMEGIEFDSLTDLRSQLAAAGVLSRDVALSSGIADLMYKPAMLALMEHLLLELCDGPIPDGYAENAQGVLIGRGVRIHPTAQVIGPIMIQHGACVEAGATLIGPAVIGEGCRVQAGTVVAQSILAECVTTDRGSSHRHSVMTCDAKLTQENLAVGLAGEAPEFQFIQAPTVFGFRSRRDERTVRSSTELVKRVLDVVLAIGGLLMLAPLMLMICALIKLESRGRIFYGQEREGKDGRRFCCWKFRTMSEGAHKLQRALQEANGLDGPQFKMENDPRVTRTGRWLRATNVDELPQLFNVLVGEMSLVGPRPSPFRENQICVPWRRARLSVRPGITGLWQVCRHRRSEGDFHQWIAYDTLYVRHRSLRLDLKILAATVFTLGGKWNLPLSWLLPEAKNGHMNSTAILRAA